MLQMLLTMTALAGPPGGTLCAEEGGTCRIDGIATVYYGAENKWRVAVAAHEINCDNATFGDPIYGTSKACYAERIGPMAESDYVACLPGSEICHLPCNANAGNTCDLTATWRVRDYADRLIQTWELVQTQNRLYVFENGRVRHTWDPITPTIAQQMEAQNYPFYDGAKHVKYNMTWVRSGADAIPNDLDRIQCTFRMADRTTICALIHRPSRSSTSKLYRLAPVGNPSQRALDWVVHGTSNTPLRLAAASEPAPSPAPPPAPVRPTTPPPAPPTPTPAAPPELADEAYYVYNSEGCWLLDRPGGGLWLTLVVHDDYVRMRPLEMTSSGDWRIAANASVFGPELRYESTTSGEQYFRGGKVTTAFNEGTWNRAKWLFEGHSGFAYLYKWPAHGPGISLVGNKPGINANTCDRLMAQARRMR